MCLSFDLDAKPEGSPLSLLYEPYDKPESEGELAKVASVRLIFPFLPPLGKSSIKAVAE